jgi:N6-L-threonylcarbamoyladenine synthase
VNFAQALALAWNIPLVPVDHMEGHLLVALCKRKSEDSSDTKEVLAIENVAFPILGLLISGAHTEINLMEEWLLYRRLGETRDDAVGEAFDKVGRMLNFPYPGGPVVASYAQKSRQGMPDASANPFKLPRPMIDSPNFDFSFSGLKTAVLYTIKDLLLQKPELPEEDKELLSRAFEDAAADVLVSKISRALEETQAQTLAIGGGVSANQYFHTRFEEMLAAKFPYVELHVPPTGLTGDNGIMIGIAGFYRFLRKEYAEVGSVVANGKLRLAST